MSSGRGGELRVDVGGKGCRLLRAACVVILATLVFAGGAAGDDRFASHWVSYSNLGRSPYDSPDAVLGKPTMWVSEPGGPGVPTGTYACSMVYPAWNVAPGGSKVVTTIGSYTTAGYIIVEFDNPIHDDPRNWDHKDFIVIGNAAFVSTGYVSYNTDMETYLINYNGSIVGESVTVAISPDNVNWYEYPLPKSDSYWPRNASAWNRGTHAWADELDPTKPVDKDLTPMDFAGLTVADAIDLYKGSAGGTAYDLAESGFAWIKYIRLTSNSGDVDAIARVSHPLSIVEAKAMEDGMPVSLGVNTVTAGASDFADCFYVQSLDRVNGIKVTGKTAESGARVVLSGVMSTVHGERAIRATWVETQGP
jgi:hypothetical protein